MDRWFGWNWQLHEMSLQVNLVLRLFEELREQHREVSNKGRTLSDSCEKLVRAISFLHVGSTAQLLACCIGSWAPYKAARDPCRPLGLWTEPSSAIACTGGSCGIYLTSCILLTCPRGSLQLCLHLHYTIA